MDKEDIIRMAHEAGLHIATDVNWMPIIGLEYAKKFANLVAAAEREAIAEMVSNCDPRATPKGIAAAIRARGQHD